MVRGARLFAILLVTALALPTSGGCVTTALVMDSVTDPTRDAVETTVRIAALAPVTLVLDAIVLAPFVLVALYAPGSADLSMPSAWSPFTSERSPATDGSRTARERLLARR